MKKIPVGSTVKAAYNFVFLQLGSIIGLIWLPMVAVTVIGFFVEQRYYEAAADAFASNNYAGLGPSVLGMFCYLVAALLLYATMFVPVMQLALGQRKGGTLLHFAFGPVEWRLFRALIGLFAFLMMPILIIGLLLESLMSFGIPGLTPQMLPGLLALVVILAYCGIVYVGLRFVFLLPAAAVSGDEPVLPRAWKLSAGNFWRILGIVLATLAPVMLAAAFAEVALEGPQTMVPSLSTTTAMAAAQLHSMSINMPLSQGIGFLIAPLLIGLGIGASAAAFTALQVPDSVTDI